MILPSDLEEKFQETIALTYLNTKDMYPTPSQINFINKMHFALYGETFEEKVKREERDKSAVEKTISIQKLIKSTDLTDEKIAEIFNTTKEIVQQIRENMKS